MCGIAGFSTDGTGLFDANKLVRVLLAGLAERGEDASGFAVRADHGTVVSEKRAKPVHEFLDELPMDRPVTAADGIVHVRDHTKGVPDIAGNNHPIHHGRIFGVHNGVIQNDEELFAQTRRSRALPGMSVDSEAIFMLLDHLHRPQEVFEQLVGSYAVAWFDDERRDSLFVSRGAGRPLYIMILPHMVLFASTTEALEFAGHVLGVRGDVTEVPIGTFYEIQHGRIRSSWRFDPQPFTEKPVTIYDFQSPQAHRARLKVLEEAFGGDLPDDLGRHWLAG